MAFRPKKKQPQFADLQGILAQTKKIEDPLYQTLQVLIDRLTQFQAVTVEEVADINNSINNAQTASINITADKFASYLTALPEELRLPNSNQLLPGVGITIDYSTPNRGVISSDGGLGRYYDAPLTDGLVPVTEIIFALGECIIVQVPNV